MSLAPAIRTGPRFHFRREYAILGLFLAVAVYGALAVPRFATPENLLQLVRSQGHLGVLAAGMTLVILIGGIDLSVGSIVALAAVSLGVVWKLTGNAPATLATGVGVGALCGLVNGGLVTRGRVPPLIVTLATLSVFRGLAFGLGGSESVGKFPPLIRSWGVDSVAGLPVPFVAALAILAGLGIYVARSQGGRAIYAVGANAAASRLSGVAVDRLKLLVYSMSGLLAGVAAVIYAGRINSVRADIGGEYELTAITMTVLGGASVSGGEGSLAGTALAFLTLVFLQNQITLLGLRSELHGVVVAVLLIGALLLDAALKRARASSHRD